MANAVRQAVGQLRSQAETVLASVQSGTRGASSALPQVPGMPQMAQEPVSQAMEVVNKLGVDAARYGDYFGNRFPQKAVGMLGNMGSMVLGAGGQGGVEVANDVFKALGIQIWIISPSSPNTRVRVNVDEDTRKLISDDSAGAMTPREFVGYMRKAKEAGNIGGFDLESYMAGLTSQAELKSIPVLPQAFQMKLYLDIAQLILFTFQRTVLQLDDAEVWGHKLKVNLMTPAARFAGRLSSSDRRRSIVGVEQLEVIVDHMLANKAVSMPMLPGPMQRRLYTNCMTVVFMLLEDLLTGENEGVSFMGHKMRFHLSPLPVEMVKRILKEQPVTHCHINEPVLTELVEELLSDSDTNLAWMPDIIESKLYHTTMRLLIRIVEQIVCRMQLSVLGRHIDMSILSHLDVKRYKIEKDRRLAAGTTYFEEENPLLTINTTELEERLKNLHERRRVLEAVRDLRGASFDLTQETPILEDTGRPRQQASAAATGTADSEAPVIKERQPHEFQRLAPTLKLARTMNQVFEVDANIEVPFTMIADLEGYAKWMPWCTSGEAPPDGVAPYDTHKVFDGKVGFGFETGTFLGTVGDTVHYQITVEPPDATGGRVLADAVNGFTYGKRLAYDWRFTSLGENKTRVELDLLFQAHNVLYMPIWDSMQNMVVNGMLGAFQKRAAVLEKERLARPEAQAQKEPEPAAEQQQSAATSAAAKSE